MVARKSAATGGQLKNAQLGKGFPLGRNLRFRHTPAISRHPPLGDILATPQKNNRLIRSTGLFGALLSFSVNLPGAPQFP